MGTVTRKTSVPIIPLRVELPAVKQKTLCEKIWGIFCCCCRKQRVEEVERARTNTEIGFSYVEDHLVMPSSPTSQTRQETHQQFNDGEYNQVTKILMKPDIPEFTEAQRAAAMHLLKNMRQEDPYLDPDRFLEIEGFPNDLVQEMHGVVALPSPSATYISTSDGGSSPTTPSTPWRGFPPSSSEDSLGTQFDQTSKDLTPLQLVD